MVKREIEIKLTGTESLVEAARMLEVLKERWLELPESLRTVFSGVITEIDSIRTKIEEIRKVEIPLLGGEATQRALLEYRRSIEDVYNRLTRLVSTPELESFMNVISRGLRESFLQVREFLETISAALSDKPEYRRIWLTIRQMLDEMEKGWEFFWSKPNKEIIEWSRNLLNVFNELGREIGSSEKALAIFRERFEESRFSVEKIVEGIREAGIVSRTITFEQIREIGTLISRGELPQAGARLAEILGFARAAGWIAIAIQGVITALNTFEDALKKTREATALFITPMGPAGVGYMAGGGDIVERWFAATELRLRIDALSRSLSISTRDFENLIRSIISSGLAFEALINIQGRYMTLAQALASEEEEVRERVVSEMLRYAIELVKLSQVTGVSADNILRYVNTLQRILDLRDLELARNVFISLTQRSQELGISTDRYIEQIVNGITNLRFFNITAREVDRVLSHYTDELRRGIIGIEDFTRVLDQFRRPGTEAEVRDFLLLLRESPKDLENLMRRLSEWGEEGLAVFSILRGGAAETERFLRNVPPEFRERFLRILGGTEAEAIEYARRISQILTPYNVIRMLSEAIGGPGSLFLLTRFGLQFAPSEGYGMMALRLAGAEELATLPTKTVEEFRRLSREEAEFEAERTRRLLELWNTFFRRSSLEISQMIANIELVIAQAMREFREGTKTMQVRADRITIETREGPINIYTTPTGRDIHEIINVRPRGVPAPTR